MSRRELPAGMPAREAAEHRARLLPPARYRHPGDVIRLHVETAG